MASNPKTSRKPAAAPRRRPPRSRNPSRPDSDDSRDHLKDVHEMLDCPVCFETMVSPIFMCRTGHNLCAPCRHSVPGGKCPQCREPMTDQRNFGLEAISHTIGEKRPGADCPKKTRPAPETDSFVFVPAQRAKPTKSPPSCKFGDFCNKLECPFRHEKKATSAPSTSSASSAAGRHARSPALCKFGTGCTKSACQFLHKQKTTSATSSNDVPSSSTVCKFHPLCDNPACIWYHPKLCMYGKRCSKKDRCRFYHPSPTVADQALLIGCTILETAINNMKFK